MRVAIIRGPLILINMVVDLSVYIAYFIAIVVAYILHWNRIKEKVSTIQRSGG